MFLKDNLILIACFLASNFQSWSNAPNIGSWKYPRKRINIWTKPPVFWVPAPLVELGECSPQWVCHLIRSSASSMNLFLYILDPFRVQIFFRPVLTLCCSSCSFKFEPIRGLRFFPKLRYSSIKNGLIHEDYWIKYLVAWQSKIDIDQYTILLLVYTKYVYKFQTHITDI